MSTHSLAKTLENGQPLFISEVYQLMSKNTIGNKVKDLVDAEDYVRENTAFPDIATVREVRSILQSRPKLFTQWEIAQIASLLPKTVDEATSLIPTLAEKPELLENDLLQDILDEILALRRIGSSFSY